jgi:hypothetical protein
LCSVPNAHRHDGTFSAAAHPPEAYSPECVEGEFSEVHIQQRA